jgi:hypothetical protein
VWTNRPQIRASKGALPEYVNRSNKQNEKKTGLNLTKLKRQTIFAFRNSGEIRGDRFAV